MSRSTINIMKGYPPLSPSVERKRYVTYRIIVTCCSDTWYCASRKGAVMPARKRFKVGAPQRRALVQGGFNEDTCQHSGR